MSRLMGAARLARRGDWLLFATRTLEVLKLRGALRRLTCRIEIPGAPLPRSLRIHVEPGDCLSDDIRRNGEWEPALSREIVSRARRGGVLVDVGANLGYFSLLWAVVRPENRVLAFEPSPQVFPKLVRNVWLNRLGDQVQAFQVALSDREGLSAFDPGPSGQNGWGGLVEVDAPDLIGVVTLRLDALLSTIPRIDVLKIDVEGADTRVLRGAERWLQEKRIGAIYFEQILDRMAALGIAPGDAAQLLEKNGYTVSRMNEPQYAVDDRITQWCALPR